MVDREGDVEIRVLVAEDDASMRSMLTGLLAEEGFKANGAASGDEAIAVLAGESVDIVLTDLRMPLASGMDVLRAARSQAAPPPVILMTAFGTIDSAVEAMKEGAYSYITKPFDIEDLVQVIGECAQQVRLRKKAEQSASTEGAGTAFPIVFRSPAFRRVLSLVHEVAESNATVLITGESGTGKELIAHEIHRRSGRRSAPFVALDVHSVPETLLESELFGHIRGSFTGATRDKVGIVEQADGGTLLLDEIGNLSVPIQAKLLRFLQERKFRRVGEASERSVELRLVAATNCDLKAMMNEGTFRDDLYYRLSVIQIRVPPLRERSEDIAPLAYHFLRKHNQGFRVDGFRPDVLDLFVDFDWPGNVRQLENAVEHAIILRKAGLIEPRDLPEWLSGRSIDADQLHARSLEVVEKGHIRRVLDDCDGNQTRAARILGIDRKTLGRKLRAWGEGDGSSD